MDTKLKNFEYEGNIVEFCSYKGNLMFHLNSIGNILGINRPDKSIDTNDAILALKLSNDMFENSQETEILHSPEGISTSSRPLNNFGELFLTEAGLEYFLSKSRKPAAKKLLEWLSTQIPIMKENIMNVKQTQTTDNKSVLINNVLVIFTEENNTIYVSSRDIAEVFEKRHDNVLRDINSLPKDEFNALNFECVSYLDPKGELRPEYRITRDGFSMIVMGFTGEKAYQWKKDFITAFNRMEAALKQQSTLPQTYLEALECLVEKEKRRIAQEKEIAALNTKIAQDAPKVELAEAISQAEGSISLNNFATILTQNGIPIGRNKLFEWFRRNGYLIRQQGRERNRPTQRSLDLRLFDVKESVTKNNETPFIVFTTFITVKGQQYFLDLFKKKKEDILAEIAAY